MAIEQELNSEIKEHFVFVSPLMELERAKIAQYNKEIEYAEPGVRGRAGPGSRQSGGQGRRKQKS